MRPFTDVEVRRWARMVGQKVCKPSGKPFKSGNKVGTVAAIGMHSHTEQLAFTMEEDGSRVECFRCELAVPENDEWTRVYRGMWKEGVDATIVRHQVSRHIQGLYDLHLETLEADLAMVCLRKLEGELAKRIQQEAEGCVLIHDR